MQELSEATKKLVFQYKLDRQLSLPKQGVETIHVDEVAKKVAGFYEKIRTIVDWKEEHLMRRAAIIRKLKRRFFNLELNNFTVTENVAESLVLELIRGGHFPNDKIAETKIGEVQKIIDKYIFILKNNPESKARETGLNFYNWLIEVSACEIEEALAPAIKEMALIDYMFGLMKEKIKVSDKIFQAGLLNKEDVDLQIYIAVCQALFKLDNPIISYNLIKYKYPNWQRADQQLLLKMSEGVFRVWNGIEKDLTNPMANKFYYICEKYDTPYLLMGDILSANNTAEAEKKISDPSALESLIKDAYSKRLSTLKSRISRAAVYSTLSIFVTKVLSLVLLEVLIEKALGSKINILLLAMDVLIPTLLMFLLVATARRPSKKNLNLVTMETMKIAYRKEGIDTYEIKMSRKKGVVMKVFLSLIYVLSAFVTFGVIYYILHYFNFPISSILIDMIFIALILFAGTAVSKRAQELTMEEEKEGFISFLSDVFFLPGQGLGRWISNKWKRYNALAALFNALIDMPFSAFVEFLEKWRYFIKDKKEEIR
ncbi:MAG: hypothetical protein NT155_01030 [Candidatus Staskawiczbacteria bacterium]|nr:hypothetical protein [Candidatus Staskawiczbacteria bacterium]